MLTRLPPGSRTVAVTSPVRGSEASGETASKSTSMASPVSIDEFGRLLVNSTEQGTVLGELGSLGFGTQPGEQEGNINGAHDVPSKAGSITAAWEVSICHVLTTTFLSV